MFSSNVVVPVVLWGSNNMTHCTSTLFLTKDSKTLVTGCNDGQICIWKIDFENFAAPVPQYLLIGHSAPILCICEASSISEYKYIVSSSENGEMCLWDLMDGKCIESTKLSQVHMSMHAYQMAANDDLRLFCNGFYAEILIMDPFSLDILFTLSSKVSPDWISALHVLRPTKRKDDVVLAITTTGIVKVWTLIEQEHKGNEPIFENESKQIRCLNAITMKCCFENQRTVLIVCSKYWQVYDAGDFTILCSANCLQGERWMGGDFISSKAVVVWSNNGKGYLFNLPTNCIPEHENFHKSSGSDGPFIYAVLSQPGLSYISCPPAMQFSRLSKNTSALIKGDSEGNVVIWEIPATLNFHALCSGYPEQLTEIHVKCESSLSKAWSLLQPPLTGALNKFLELQANKVTASTYIPQQNRLIIGTSDGKIIIISATQMVSETFFTKNTETRDWTLHQELVGHIGRVNCLLYPYLCDTRYDKYHLVSGGVDFSVCLWDLQSKVLLHKFCIHAGEITQLLAPPGASSARVQKCICSVASDHSVALLSLQERKCITLASRHLFPVITIKWRPLDDFMIVGCSDGSAYIWQMETGHLDRILHGMLANEVLSACDDTPEDTAEAPSVDSNLVNPAVHLFRGLKHRNLTAIKHATQRGFHQLQQLHAGQHVDLNVLLKNRSNPLLIQGLKTNPQDAESHILFFDIEGLIFELHSEEYQKMMQNAAMSLKTEQGASETSKKITDFFGKVKAKTENLEKTLKEKDKHGIFAKVKEGAENIQVKVQAKVESVVKNIGELNKDSNQEFINCSSSMETTFVMELAQLVLSLIHAWGLDSKLDLVCKNELGLLQPTVPITFGKLSKGGYMSLILPTWLSQDSHSNHLLAIVALANTLMTMNLATFTPSNGSSDSAIKQAWSQLSTFYCFLLPEKVSRSELKVFQRKQVETLARRWQHHCYEIREAAQQLLLSELERMGKKGRKQLVDCWAPYLPLYSHVESLQEQCDTEPEEEEEEDESTIRKPSSMSELKKKQTTAVVILGIIGAQYFEEITYEKQSNDDRRDNVASEGEKNNLPRLIAMALAHLVLSPPTTKLPAYTPLRRAAIDLIGRGFTVWEPYIDISKVLIGLLELCCDSHRLIPDLNYRLPLTPQADACRTARNTLRVIATARPDLFITTMAREVARYNAAQQNAQALSVPITQSVLNRAKSEILMCIEMLIEKLQSDVSKYLIAVMDIIIHCVDMHDLKNKGLHEVCPLICKYNQVSHCSISKRIAAGAVDGRLAIYELKQSKCQMMPAHSHPITALAFSPDGKYLVSYSCHENKLSFWQTSSGMFGLGSSQIKCVKNYSTAPIPDTTRFNSMRLAKLIWISNRIVTLMLADGSETRFSI